jgi:hypothetical protein
MPCVPGAMACMPGGMGPPGPPPGPPIMGGGGMPCVPGAMGWCICHPCGGI